MNVEEIFLRRYVIGYENVKIHRNYEQILKAEVLPLLHRKYI